MISGSADGGISEINAKLDRILKAITDGGRPAKRVRLLSLREAASLYRISHETVRGLIESGKLRAKARPPRNGKVAYYINADDAERVLGAP